MSMKTIIAISLLLCGSAQAHEALPSKMQPTGWQYGWECCSFNDCRQVSTGDVSQTPAGYLIKQTGEIIPYLDSRIKRSKDEFYHQCTVAGDPQALHSICLYAPDQGF